MNLHVCIEDAASPEEFIAALRQQASKCDVDAMTLASAWDDNSAGSFWSLAATELEKLADRLEWEQS